MSLPAPKSQREQRIFAAIGGTTGPPGANGAAGRFASNVDATWRTALATGTWTGAGSGTVQSITVAGGAGVVNRCLRDFGITRATGYDAMVEIVSIGTPASQSYGMFIAGTDENNGYVLEFQSGGSNGTFYKFVAGAATSIGSMSGKAVAGDVMGVTVSATGLAAYRWRTGTKTSLGSVTDTTFTTGTLQGLYVFDTGTSVFRNLTVG